MGPIAHIDDDDLEDSVPIQIRFTIFELLGYFNFPLNASFASTYTVTEDGDVRPKSCFTPLVCTCVFVSFLLCYVVIKNDTYHNKMPP